MHIDFLIPADYTTHVSCCLMQGCVALGHSVYTNSRLDNPDSRGISMPFAVVGMPALEITNSLFHELLFVDVSYGLGNYTYEQLAAIAQHRPVVLLNMADDANYRDYDDTFIIFSSHLSRIAPRHGRVFPLAFGLSDDIIARAAAADLTQKQPRFVRNFTPSFSQSVRDCLDLVLVEPLAARFEVDRRRTDVDAYFEQLTNSSAVLAYGGALVPNVYQHDYLRGVWEARGDRSHLFKRFDADVAVLRWDSWRYFEAAVMACAPLHLDFEKYGFVLPVNPEPWVEYIPIDLASVSNLPEHLADRLSDDPDFLKKVGQGARAWALKHHSPIAQATTILETIAAHWQMPSPMAPQTAILADAPLASAQAIGAT